MPVDAKAIYEELLQSTGAALAARDSEAWRAQLTSPHLVITTDGRLLMSTAAAFEQNMERFLHSLEASGIVRTERQCIAAHMVKPGMICGYHTIQHFDANDVALPGMEAKWTLQKGTDDRWRVAKNEVAASTRQFTKMQIDAFDGAQGHSGDRQAALQKIAQTVLESMDAMGASGDYQGWVHVVILPLHIVSGQGSKVLTTPRELHQEFAANKGELAQKGMTDCVRVVQHVEEAKDATLIAHFRAHLMNNGRYITPPWDGKIHLRNANGFWRVFRIIRPHGHAAVLPEGS